MKNVLVTGGCGFIGTNLTIDRLRRGDSVRVFDSCARDGSKRNWQALDQLAAAGRLELIRGDVRDADALTRAMADVEVVFHLAAQVAVTTAVNDPRLDFEVNALGTLNVLEAARNVTRPPLVLFASTNKVYGALNDHAVRLGGERYGFAALPDGVNEETPLDFHSPYGCSKGSADQYVLDYARIYGLRTIVMRQSCIYGPWQRGNEDQGWVAHFATRAMRGEPITIYGDGFQVRDVLFVDDLLEAYDLALQHADGVAGRAYNIGGGTTHTASLVECAQLLERVFGHEVPVSYGGWRPGDQRIYVSDVGRAERELGWRPVTSFEAGVRRMVRWLEADHRAANARSVPGRTAAFEPQTGETEETDTQCAA